MSYLFIGGPADGKRISVPEGYPCYRMPVRNKPISFVDPPVGFSNEPAFSVVTYERVRLGPREEVFWPPHEGLVNPVALMIRQYPDPEGELVTLVRKLLDDLPDISRGKIDPDLYFTRARLYELISTES